MVRLELDVQDLFYKSACTEGIHPGESECSVTAEMWTDWFTHWLEILYAHLPTARGYEIGLRLTDDGEIQRLNAQYRDQNQPTDVLSFAALEVDCPENPELLDEPLYLGDIVISVNTAEQQAKQQGHSLLTELAWLAAHGLLHLLGWDHPDEEQLVHMLNQQLQLLQEVSININIDI